MQPVAVPERAKALLHKRSPPGLVCGACRDERDAAECECRLAAARATGCECGLLPCHESNRLRLQAVTVPRTAKHCSGNEAL